VIWKGGLVTRLPTIDLKFVSAAASRTKKLWRSGSPNMSGKALDRKRPDRAGRKPHRRPKAAIPYFAHHACRRGWRRSKNRKTCSEGRLCAWWTACTPRRPREAEKTHRRTARAWSSAKVRLVSDIGQRTGPKIVEEIVGWQSHHSRNDNQRT